jgi:hypothetical protein
MLFFVFPCSFCRVRFSTDLTDRDRQGEIKMRKYLKKFKDHQLRILFKID